MAVYLGNLWVCNATLSTPITEVPVFCALIFSYVFLLLLAGVTTWSHTGVCVFLSTSMYSCHKHNSGMNGPVCGCRILPTLPIPHTLSHSSSPSSTSGRFCPAGYSCLHPSLHPLVLHRVVLHLCHPVRSSHGVSHHSHPLLHTIWYTHTHTHTHLCSLVPRLSLGHGIEIIPPSCINLA